MQLKNHILREIVATKEANNQLSKQDTYRTAKVEMLTVKPVITVNPVSPKRSGIDVTERVNGLYHELIKKG